MSGEGGKSGARTYRKRRRAEQERRTRERITEAAVRLHGTVGPARTTVSGVAKEAGVQRATVYRHFPDEVSLFAACSAQYWATNPMPDPGAWSSISDPEARLRHALGEMYAFFRHTEGMLEKTSRDAPLVEAMARPVAEFRGYLNAAAAAIIAGRPERGKARRRVQAVVGHAVSFPTWQSLVRQQGLKDTEAVAVMAALVESAGGARPAEGHEHDAPPAHLDGRSPGI
jgi:AcrR family transcriptional regulator